MNDGCLSHHGVGRKESVAKHTGDLSAALLGSSRANEKLLVGHLALIKSVGKASLHGKKLPVKGTSKYRSSSRLFLQMGITGKVKKKIRII